MGSGQTTNNKMELEAVRQAILLGATEVFTDSLYSVRVLRKTSHARKNIAQVHVIRDMMAVARVSVDWVSSKIRHPDHVMADRLSKEGRLYG